MADHSAPPAPASRSIKATQDAQSAPAALASESAQGPPDAPPPAPPAPPAAPPVQSAQSAPALPATRAAPAAGDARSAPASLASQPAPAAPGAPAAPAAPAPLAAPAAASGPASPESPEGPAIRLVNAIRRLVKTQKYSQLKFSFYRNGNWDYTLSWQYIQGLRDSGMSDLYDRVMARPIPKGNYRGIFGDAERVILQDIADDNVEYLGRPRPRAGVRAAMTDAAISAARRQVRLAGRKMSKVFRFIKFLGNGGQGMVTLWEYRSLRGPVHRLVLKVSTASKPNPDPNQVASRLLRAPHILQRFVFEDDVPQNRSNRIGQRNTTQSQAIDNDEGILFMEYARFGDLRELLNKAARAAPANQQLPFPVQVLWRFFDCLVKGCIAMDYPPRAVPANFPNNAAANMTEAPTAGGYLPETIPPGGLAGNVAGHAGIVHFDLDHANIFITDYDRPGPNGLVPAHTGAPRLQIADFGLAEDAKELWAPAAHPNNGPIKRARVRYEKWDQRRMGKNRWFLPEQFSVDWDAIALDPSAPSPPGLNWPPWAPWPITSGPGRYTHRSNVWHLGMVMYCLMTFEEPQFPPVAGRFTKDEPGGMAYGLVPRRQQRWTYGYKLVDPDPANEQTQELQTRYGTHLCEVVARCLMNKQEHRPNLQQLQDWVTAELSPPPGGGPPPADSPAAPVPARWKADMLGNPPRPRPGLTRMVNFSNMKENVLCSVDGNVGLGDISEIVED
ncbi:hypothetical protein VM1G_02307 [Cytospora mali]|uniref:Protein kinase domain-containing protein n=1 Tax=Cytospora mali TaxID=578113 RepID=A0A194VST3_CYTMA|nr:hypothetical protein VM1G_02307 [Valsa mali]